MLNNLFYTPEPINEPVRGYVPGSSEREELLAEVNRRAQEIVEIPIVVGGERMLQTTPLMCACHVIMNIAAQNHLATPEVVEKTFATA